jgi:hypothetical protein
VSPVHWAADARAAGYWEGPNPARVWAVLVDGERMFAPDERAASAVLSRCPAWAGAARMGRAWVWTRVHDAAEDGFAQFADLGCGFPTSRCVHSVASAVTPRARTLYMDVDPMVVTHLRSWACVPGRSGAVGADVRDAEDLTEVLTGRAPGGVGWDRRLPVVVTMGALLEALTDAEVTGLFRELAEVLTPGSRVVLTHTSGERVRDLEGPGVNGVDADDGMGNNDGLDEGGAVGEVAGDRAPILEAVEAWRTQVGPFHLRGSGELARLVCRWGWQPLTPGVGQLGRWGGPFVNRGVIGGVVSLLPERSR